MSSNNHKQLGFITLIFCSSLFATLADATYENKKFTPAMIVFQNHGYLPEYPSIKTYDLPKDLPEDAQSMLLYAYVTTHNIGPFQRGYYIFSTKEGDEEYQMNMNFATGLAVTMNSMNVWLPVTSERKLYVELVYSGSESVAYKEEIVENFGYRGEWSQVFITGYN